MYTLSRSFWNYILDSSVELAYVGVDFHVSSSCVSLMGNVLLAVVMCISYFFFNKKSVRVMGDLEQACCFSFGRCREPPYLAVIYSVRPWYMVPSWPWSLRA